MTHCPYLPDLSPNGFFLFPNIKKKSHGEQFVSSEIDIEASLTLVSEAQPQSKKKCFEKWFKRMQKCVDLKGEYFEKQ